MKKTILTVLLSFTLLSLAITPALAVEIDVGMTDVQTEAGFSSQNLTETIGKVIKIVLGFLGLIALILFIVGGFKWMTSGGNEESIAEAKKLMSAAVVGLFIILIAYAATTFIINRLSSSGVVGCVDGTYKCVDGSQTANALVACNAADHTWTGAATNCTADRFCTVDDVGTITEICTETAATQ